MDEHYPYSAVDRLAEPCHYMYTAFQGEAFLRAYRDARGAFRRAAAQRLPQELEDSAPVILLASACRARLRSLDEDPPFSCGGVPVPGGVEAAARSLEARGNATLGVDTRYSRDAHPDEEVDTDRLLRSLLSGEVSRALSASGPPQESIHTAWTLRLIQRFEVTKKLYQGYATGFRRGLGDCHDIRRYVIFGSVLALAYPGGEDLRLLNALLKVNDLVCSVNEPHGSDGVVAVAHWYGLVAEDAFVRRLMAAKGVADAGA